MNVKELGTMMQAAFQREGLEARQIVAKAPKAWTIPTDGIVRFFQPHASRRPWGVVYSGAIGIEVPALRQWLRAYKVGEEGVFHSCFISYLIVNEDVFRGFMVSHGDPVPTDLWAGLLKDRLEQIPETLADLIAAYRRNKEELGWLAHPHEKNAWDFLLRWQDDPDPALHVPKMQPEGRIA
jgi:hypothetical protein